MKLKVREVLAILTTLLVLVGGIAFSLLEQIELSAVQRAAPKEVSISVLNDQIDYGVQVNLSANVTGVKGRYRLQWEVNDGNGWRVIEGAEEAEYHYIFSPENETYSYRVFLKMTV